MTLDLNTIFRKNQSKHFVFSASFDRKSCRLCYNVEKYGGNRT
jgi:hypothetical protein